jgi:hypothetical protein
MDLSAIASEDRMGTPMGKGLGEEEDDKPQSLEPVSRDPRSPMDPQSKKALDEDIKRLEKIGMNYSINGKPCPVRMEMDKRCLITFNRFMHLFIIITRHSKEQFIKEQRKCQKERRRAFKLRNWKEYGVIVQHEIDIERVKYLDVINYTLNYFDTEKDENGDPVDPPRTGLLPEGAYRSSFMKYSMNRVRDLQMKDAR